MDYLIRLVQIHESFRRAELDALALLAGVEIEVVSYLEDSPFCIIRFPKCKTAASATAAAKRFISRSILSRCIYELWGSTPTGDYDNLHDSVRKTSSHLWLQYERKTFAFTAYAFNGTLSLAQQRERINSFKFLDFKGRVELKKPEEQFAILEEYEYIPTNVLIPPSDDRKPKRMFFGRWLADSARYLVDVHDLKKRPYISTTSMDAELALVTANLALAAPGKLFYDPFMGTGGFLVSSAQFGAVVLGSDIDGRSFRGEKSGRKKTKGPTAKDGPPLKGVDTGIGKNMVKYGTRDKLVDCFVSDLTNTPLLNAKPQPTESQNGKSNREDGWLDGIVSDPPYGVREGLKVLGLRKADSITTGPVTSPSSEHPSQPPPNLIQYIDGIPAHTLPGYIAPKKPYSFTKMLDDILEFASITLVNDARLTFWMPVFNAEDPDADDETKDPKQPIQQENSAEKSPSPEDQTIEIPSHPDLELVSHCVQQFNKWSRRLLTYRRRRRNDPTDIYQSPEQQQQLFGVEGTVSENDRPVIRGRTADDLNEFRRRYFQSTRSSPSQGSGTEQQQPKGSVAEEKKD